ncbi:MAG TPA: ATP-dependent helicase [Acidimicrobiales bacterium]|nr:ATP-dependent helicase [Acidimicrobiales bacterium]
MFASGWDEGLDDEQLAVAMHGDAPLVVIAGAGTGKTRALTSRVASLLDRGVPPERILLLTYTRRAASDMLARAARLVGVQRSDSPTGGTFHAIAHRHVAAYAEVLDLPKTFGVLDPTGAIDLMDLLRGEHDLTGTATRFPRSATLVDIYSRCINTERPLRDLVASDYPWCEPHLDQIGGLFRAFTSRKRRSALLDFDDLLLYWRALLNEQEIGPHLAERFRFVLVDEYQDVNSLQVDIVRRLAPDGRGLTVVGDEAQAIYGFRGSDPRHLRCLVRSFPEATTVRLERNFRSRQSILTVANAVRPASEEEETIRLFSDRGSGTKPTLVRCHDAPSEARAIVDGILEALERGVLLRRQAVLVRAGHHSDLIEVELSVRKVPYRKYGGLRFLEAAHVKDFVSAARLVDNPNDEVAWYRVLRLHRNIGPTRARTLIGTIQPSTADALSRWPEVVAAAPPSSRSHLSASLGRLLESREQGTPGLRAEAVLAVVKPLVEDRYDDASVRLGDLERLVGAASVVDDLSTWLADLTLDPPASTGDLARSPELDEDYVVISTIHSAKGLEWSVVHVPHMVDGALPSDMALRSLDGLEEERRLFYVAVTRARDELFLYAPLRMPHHRHASDDRHSFAPMSRFLDDDVRATLNVVDEAPTPMVVNATASTRVVVDLDPLWN